MDNRMVNPYPSCTMNADHVCGADCGVPYPIPPHTRAHYYPRDSRPYGDFNYYGDTRYGDPRYGDRRHINPYGYDYEYSYSGRYPRRCLILVGLTILALIIAVLIIGFIYNTLK